MSLSNRTDLAAPRPTRSVTGTPQKHAPGERPRRKATEKAPRDSHCVLAQPEVEKEHKSNISQ